VPLILLLLLSPPALASTVTIDGDRWRDLQPEDEAFADLRRPHATERDVDLIVLDDRVLIHATWRIDPGEETWFAERIIGFDAAVEGVYWNGRPAHAHAVRRGYLVLERLDGPATLELVASVPRSDRPIALLPASRGRATLTGEDVELGGGAVALGPGYQLAGPLVVQPKRPPPPSGSLTDARVGLGLTIEDGSVSGRGRIELVPKRGALASVSFTAAGVGADLTVSGPDVATVERSGDRFDVTLRAEFRRRVTLDLAWTSTLPDKEVASVAVPKLHLLSVHRTQTTLQLARSGEREVVPQIRGQAIASRDLPEWGLGLVAGQPTAAFAGPSGTVDLLRFQPADGPPAIVDVAEYTAAATAEGRTLMKARYAVRADRAAALEVTPPPGCTLLAVRVDGRTEPPSITSTGAWRVPLPRSVESVDGLLSFPVELAWLHEDASWTRTEDRALPLPSVDAPIAVQRATVHLPPGFRSRKAEGDDRRVAAFSRGEGIRYGFALDEDGEAKKEAADALYGAAINAWKSNEFDAAQNYLDGLGEMGASNMDVSRLQRNLDVVEGRDESTGVATRRVLEQAKARGKKKRRVYDSKVREAEERSRAGDKVAAQEAAKEALVLGGELSKLEQRESVELDASNEELGILANERRRAPRRSRGANNDAPDSYRAPNFDDEEADEPAAPPLSTLYPDSTEYAAAETFEDLEEAIDDAPAIVVDGSIEQLELDRLMPGTSGLDKFDYGDPEVDQWVGRGSSLGVGGLGSFGSGRGGGGYGMGHGVAHKPAVFAVVAATRSVPIPRLGEALLFQRLLLPAGATQTLPLRARRASGGT
jgi:hypothetical protein